MFRFIFNNTRKFTTYTPSQLAMKKTIVFKRLQDIDHLYAPIINLTTENFRKIQIIEKEFNSHEISRKSIMYQIIDDISCVEDNILENMKMLYIDIFGYCVIQISKKNYPLNNPDELIGYINLEKYKKNIDEIIS